MAMVSGIYTSVKVGEQDGIPIGSHAVDQEFLMRYLGEFLTDGIFPSPATNFAVRAGTGMQVVVQPGIALVAKHMGYDDDPYSITLAAADPSLTRIDRIVLRSDEIEGKISIEVLQGTPASADYAATPLTRGADVWELAIADVLVKPGATAITQAEITDTRPDSGLCGWVVNAMQTIDVTAFFAQMQAQFDTWFATIQGQLSEDVAGQLLANIEAHKADTAIHRPIYSGSTPAESVLTEDGDIYLRHPEVT